MCKYQTIQKVAADMGIDPSLIHTLIKDEELHKYTFKGRKRVFIDTEELEALIVPVTEIESKSTNGVDLSNFEV